MSNDFLKNISAAKTQESRYARMLVFSDWLEEHGDLDEATGWRWIVNNKFVPRKLNLSIYRGNGIARPVDRWSVEQGEQGMPDDRRWRYIVGNLLRHDGRIDSVCAMLNNSEMEFDARIKAERAVAVTMGLYLSGKRLVTSWA